MYVSRNTEKNTYKKLPKFQKAQKTSNQELIIII